MTQHTHLSWGRRDAGSPFVLRFLFAFLLPIFLVFSTSAFAQTGGQGALEGTVTDQTGAMIPHATVTAINQASKVATTRVTSGAGRYSITPLIPGVYTLTVKAEGFQTLTQKNIEVNGLNSTGFNVKLAIGSSQQEVVVTAAPPLLQTTNPSIGDVITNHTYESLPIVMNNQQRDPTALATLATGAQSGSRAPNFSGTGNYLSEVYLDGIPTTTANMQSDNRVISNGVPVESVEQMQIITSGPSAEYQGAGAIGLTIKSGGNKYHGQIVDIIRNTAFDTWGFAGNSGTKIAIVNGKVTSVPAGKPVEHQNELSVSAGGPIPFTRHHGFFFANYDKFHGRRGVNPTLFTVPTVLMKQGDFTELGSSPVIYNPLTNSCTGSTCTRQPFQGLKNGVPTYNVIPAEYLSPISKFEQKFLPDPNLPGTVDNFVTTGLSGYDNHELVFKVDYDWSSRQRISFVYSHGVRQSAGYGAVLPIPYTSGDSSVIAPTMIMVEDSYEFTPHLVNQFKYGFTRFPQVVVAPTDGLSQYSAMTAGITGLPKGQSSGNFPGSKFSTSKLFADAPYQWTENGASDASHAVVPNAFTLVDNLEWTVGKHDITFGVQTQWLEDNVTSQSSPSGIYTQTWDPAGTANFTGTALDTTTSGYSYASFLLGAVHSAGTSVPLFQSTGGRFHPISPYVQDDWKILPNLTLNLGLRWDYLPPYHEVQDRWSFFNPNAINPLTNSPGELQYAGNRGADISCQCRTPVHTYWKNFGPRLGIEYAPDATTVFRAGFAVAYSRAGGVGGRAGDSTGTGQSGFGSNIVLPSATTKGIDAGPSYYLNNSTAFQAAGVANTNFGGPGYSIPAPTGPSAASLLNGIGNYVDASGHYVNPGGAPHYADPYLSGRAPEFVFYNFGMQKAITNNLTITAQYAGSQSHFVAGATVPGFWSGRLNPRYLATLGSVFASDGKTNILNATATPQNIAIAQAADPSVKIPYPAYAAAASVSTKPTIARMLEPFPQYSGAPSPEWDNIGNLSYNAFELTLKQREWKGISFTLNYTYSKNLGDDGTTRASFAVPAAASSSGTAIPGNNRADRALVASDLPENLNLFGYIKSPFGRNKIGSNNWLVRNVAGGWQFAGILTYHSGVPILVVDGTCTSPGQGTCMPDMAPGRSIYSVRINGGYAGHGVTYANYKDTPYLDKTAYSDPAMFAAPKGAVALTKIGTAPRDSTALREPGTYNVDASLTRSFNLKSDRYKFVFRADCFDVTNKVTFSMGQTQNLSSSTFGKLTSFSGQRLFQFSGRIVF